MKQTNENKRAIVVAQVVFIDVNAYWFIRLFVVCFMSSRMAGLRVIRNFDSVIMIVGCRRIIDASIIYPNRGHVCDKHWMYVCAKLWSYRDAFYVHGIIPTYEAYVSTMHMWQLHTAIYVTGPTANCPKMFQRKSIANWDRYVVAERLQCRKSMRSLSSPPYFSSPRHQLIIIIRSFLFCSYSPLLLSCGE